MIPVTNEEGTRTVNIEFNISERDGQPIVGVERIDVRKEKRYGIRLTVGCKIEIKEDWQLMNKLASLTRRHANKIAGEYAKTSFYGSGGDVTLSAFIAAESPKKILDSSAPQCREVVAKMLAALEKAFEAALAEHEADVSANVDVRIATHIASWAANKVAKDVEADMDYAAKIKVINDEREARIRAQFEDTTWITDAVKESPELKATERAVATALAKLSTFVDSAARAPSSGFMIRGTRDEITRNDLVDANKEEE